MKRFLVKRLIVSVFVLFGVSILLYALIRSMPGDYITNTFANNPNATPEMISGLKVLYGLDKGILEGYFGWLSNALRGDFGVSFVYGKPVAEIIGSKMWVSFALAFPAFLLQYLLAIPFGVVSATRQYSKTDYGVTVFAMVGISLPSFFFAALLQRIFAMGLGWLPLQGMTTAREDYEGFRRILDMGWHFILPVIVLTVTSMGSLMRYTRTSMLEVLRSDYIRTARSKGLKEGKVVYRHAFRNTLIPLITIAGSMLPSLFSGAIITEGIFAIDGLGYTSLQALRQGDIPFIMGFNIFLAVLTLLGTLLADISYGLADPRVRLE